MTRDVLQNVQSLRFVAAVCIVVEHTGDVLLPKTSPLFTINFGTGVDIFFLISGFIMAHISRGQFGSRDAAGPFLARRMLRIAPPYWFFTGLMLFAAVVFPNQIGGAILAPEVILTSLTFIPCHEAMG